MHAYHREANKTKLTKITTVSHLQPLEHAAPVWGKNQCSTDRGDPPSWRTIMQTLTDSRKGLPSKSHKGWGTCDEKWVSCSTLCDSSQGYFLAGKSDENPLKLPCWLTVPCFAWNHTRASHPNIKGVFLHHCSILTWTKILEEGRNAYTWHDCSRQKLGEKNLAKLFFFV